MDRALKDREPRFKFSLLGTDWVEWLIIALLCAFAAFGVSLLSGSVLPGVVAGGILLCACSVVVALL
ncbi:hypothetical protein [Antrihabitans cavernicola]|uniref:Uncharacterized protein n=1 Tax=Antrihabitans cavernicola TaxID=2495913 RepID=A0A5A7S6G7_9NOCA|nr:hypothetical protein [Spelaeibacter cavernicola]KAA0021738.1 hypothetical protein FOY51_17800 [Spelaeibacter cavernicola]